jgi:uncharacterized membrane protein YraQ (UPF0718 family)
MNLKQRQDKHIISSFIRSLKNFAEILPVLLSVILLLGLFQTFISEKMILSVFTGNIWRDTLIGAVIGSLSAGNPVISYMIGGELLKQGVNLLAVISFMLTWVTVGLIQLPAEAQILGKRFAITRNIISFVLAILVSIITVATLALIR